MNPSPLTNIIDEPFDLKEVLEQVAANPNLYHRIEQSFEKLLLEFVEEETTNSGESCFSESSYLNTELIV